jgi:hypothetical protein
MRKLRALAYGTVVGLCALVPPAHAAAGATKQAYSAPALERRWGRLEQMGRGWRPFRMTQEGEIAPFAGDPMTSSGQVFRRAFEDRFTNQYSFLRVQQARGKGPDRIVTLLRDNQTKKVMAEVRWREGEGFTVIAADGKVERPSSK